MEATQDVVAMTIFSTIFGVVLLIAGAMVLRFSYMLLRLTFRGAPVVTGLSGSPSQVFWGRVNPWNGEKRNPQISAGLSYREANGRGSECPEGFVSDEVVNKVVRDLG